MLRVSPVRVRSWSWGEEGERRIMARDRSLHAFSTFLEVSVEPRHP